MTLTVYAICLACLSLVSFVFYGADKSKAKRGAWRIPEATLLSLSFFGGAIGGYLAMKTFRHKTRKWYFHFVNIVGILWQTAVLIYLFGSPDLLF